MKFLFEYLVLFALISHITASSSAKSSNNKPPLQKTMYEWKRLEFSLTYDNYLLYAEGRKEILMLDGAMPIDVQPYYDNQNVLRTFVTIPSFHDSIPYTLTTVSSEHGRNGPLLKPYPNFEAHNNRNKNNCSAITSAFRMAIDECNRMWVIDSGVVSSKSRCAPQLLLFDLNTNEIVHRYRFNAAHYTPGASLFITPVVDVRDPPPRGSCRRTMVYIADVNYHGLVVYDFMQNNAWRIENMYMYPDPNYGVHTVAGESFMLMDGIFGMATDKRNLYFHPFSSLTEYAVPLNVIDNRTLLENNPRKVQEAFRPVNKRHSPCTVSAMDSKNNLYCVTIDPIKLTKLTVNSNEMVEIPIRDANSLQFVSGIKVITNKDGIEQLWMISNKYQKAAARTRDFKETNFRIETILLNSDKEHDLPKDEMI